MQVYFVFAPEDESFVERLSNDLQQNGFAVTLNPAFKDLKAAATTDAILAPLSEPSTNNTAFIEQLASIKSSHAQVIVLRTGTIRDVPEALKGILPLDFSSDDSYEDALQTLIEDLEPPTVNIEFLSILPDGIEQRLSSDSADERLKAIQHIGDLLATFETEQLEYAERLLRDLVFRDTNSNVKQLARVTLQLLSTTLEEASEDEQDTLEVVTHTSPIDELPDDPNPIIINTNTIVPAKSQLLVFSQHWWLLPIAGVLLALGNAIYIQNALGALPIGLVWLILPWFNVTIRDGGRFDWKMPGPVIGNALVGMTLSVVGTVIIALLGATSGLDAIAFISGGIVYGILIGWMSAFYLPT